MLVAEAAAATVCSVGVEPNGVPAGVVAPRRWAALGSSSC